MTQVLERVRKRVTDAAPKKELVWARNAAAVVLLMVTEAGPHLLSPPAGAVLAHSKCRRMPLCLLQIGTGWMRRLP